MIELNKVLLVGRLTRDPELKYIPSGTAVCEMRIASDRRYYDRNAGENKKDTLFINVTAWGKTAEFCNEYMNKGKGIFVEGRLKLETWKDKDGNNRERISINADRVSFGESKAEQGARAAMGSSREEGDSGGGSQGGETADPSGPSEKEDDLPF